jgi:hypothetical protein
VPGLTAHWGDWFPQVGRAAKLEWERVNEVTWKLTDGEMTNVPRSHGQWGGYRTSKAVAWVIDVSATDKAAWIARYKDQCSNPMPLKQAKAVAMAMAKSAPGDYRVTSPIAHLNGITARLLDSEAPADGDLATHGWLTIKRMRAGLFPERKRPPKRA